VRVSFRAQRRIVLTQRPLGARAMMPGGSCAPRFDLGRQLGQLVAGDDAQFDDILALLARLQILQDAACAVLVAPLDVAVRPST